MGKTFLTRIEQLIDEVCFNADGPAKEMGNEHLGECGFLMDHADDSGFFQPHDDGVRHCRDRRYAPRLPGQTTFAEKFARTRIATTASLPCSETMVAFALPFWRSKTASAGSPCDMK